MLKWQLVCGPKAKELEQVEKRRGKLATDAIRPEIPLWCNDFYRAYNFLAGRRQHDMGSPQPIPLSEILGYASTFGFQSELRLLILCVTEMDTEYFEFQNLKADQARTKAKNKK